MSDVSGKNKIMIDAVSRGNSHYQRIERTAPEPDLLAAKRADESRRLVVAGLQKQHQERVRLAVQAYMDTPVRPAESASGSLTLAHKTYAEF